MVQGGMSGKRVSGAPGRRVRRVALGFCMIVIGPLAGASAALAAAPANTALPSVSGTVGEGHTLTAANGTWTGAEPITYAYQWERCNSRGACGEISGATSSTYVQTAADTGRLVLVAVTASNGEGSATATSSGMQADSWGQDDHGQLGTIYKDPFEELPVGVEGLATIKAFAAAESFNLDLLSNGTIASSGGDSHGQLGDDEYKANWERESSHEMVKNLKEVIAVQAANEHALALTKNGKVYAWGANNDGILGQGVGGFEGESGIDSRIPNEVPGLKEKVKAIAVGGASNYALLQGGEVEAWGQNTDGELGVEWNSECLKSNSTAEVCKPFICKTGGGPQLCETSAEPVVDSENHPIKGVVAIYAGNEAGYAVLESGKVLSWGSNKFGALGQPSVTTSGSGAKFVPPGEVKKQAGLGSEALTGVREISGGSHHALALLESGEVLGWGSGEEGGLGELPVGHPTCGGKTPCMTQAAPIKGLELVTAEAVAAGSAYSLVLSAGQVYAFGRDSQGELANGTTTEDSTPTVVSSLGSGVREIAAGPTHGLALVAERAAPYITVHRETGIVRIVWGAGEKPYHLNFDEFTHPGLTEPEEGAEEEFEESEGVLVPKSRPKIKHTPVSPGNYTTLEQSLEGSNGSWKGAEPITYTYQWQRCTLPVEGACSNISGETTNKYKPTEADLGDYLRFLVTAKNAEVEGGVTASSELTTAVTKTTGKEVTKYSINIKKEEEKGELTGTELSVPQTGHSGEPKELGHIPWEFKLEFTPKARWFVATPG
jgi:alpha-tubulin suppressor-like RCC1 family protein